MAFAWRFAYAMHRLAPPQDRGHISTHGRVTDGVRGAIKSAVLIGTTSQLLTISCEEKQRRGEALGALPVNIGPQIRLDGLMNRIHLLVREASKGIKSINCYDPRCMR
jgi:hypothetical protein